MIIRNLGFLQQRIKDVIEPLLNALEFEITENSDNSAFLLSSTKSMNFWRGPDDDGFCQIFDFDPNTGTVTGVGIPYEMDTVMGAHHSAFYINDDYVMDFWQGDANDGFCQIFQIDTGTGSVTPLGTPLEFDTIFSLDNSAIIIDANFAINFWTGSGSNGFCQMFALDVAGPTYVSAIDSPVNFDNVVGTDNSCVLLDNTHVINFWRGSGGGFAQIFRLKFSSAPYITPLATPYNYDVQAGNPSVLFLKPGRVMNFWQGPGADGFCQIYSVNTSTGAIAPQGALVEFDTNFADYISAVLIDQTHVACFYEGGPGGTGSNGSCRLFEIDSGPGTITPIEDIIVFDSNITLHHSAFKVNGNRLMNFWTGLDNDGFTQLFRVNYPTDPIAPKAIYKNFNPINSYNSSFMIDDCHAMNFWGGTDDDGFCQIFDVNKITGVITPMASPYEFDVVAALYNSSLLIDATHVMNFWRGPGNDGWCQIFEIDISDGSITPVGSAYEFYVTDVAYNSAFLIDSTHVMNFWSGDGNDGFCQIFEINTGTGAITPLGTPTEFDTDLGQYNSAFLLDSTHVMNFWNGGSGQGYCQVFEINAGTGAVTPLGSATLFNNFPALYNSALKIDGTHVACFWNNTSTSDGYARVFEVTPSTGAIVIGGLTIYDSVNVQYNSAVLASGDKIVNFWVGSGNDGFCQLFNVDTSGNFMTPIGTAYEFDEAQSTYNSAFMFDSTNVMNFWEGANDNGFARIFELNY